MAHCFGSAPLLFYMMFAYRVVGRPNTLKWYTRGTNGEGNAMGLEQVYTDADEAGIRLELVGGLPLWEPDPVYRHQKAIDRIRATIEPFPSNANQSCHYIHVTNVYVALPDGSLKRPDVAIFCREPDEQEEAVTLIPAAVIEVVSKGYEAKDLDIGPRFYLTQGVADIVVFDPATLLVLHIRRDRTVRHISPVQIELECGCRCVV
jgi:Uma2 family endonuclease